MFVTDPQEAPEKLKRIQGRYKNQFGDLAIGTLLSSNWAEEVRSKSGEKIFIISQDIQLLHNLAAKSHYDVMVDLAGFIKPLYNTGALTSLGLNTNVYHKDIIYDILEQGQLCGFGDSKVKGQHVDFCYEDRASELRAKGTGNETYTLSDIHSDDPGQFCRSISKFADQLKEIEEEKTISPHQARLRHRRHLNYRRLQEERTIFN